MLASGNSTLAEIRSLLPSRHRIGSQRDERLLPYILLPAFVRIHNLQLLHEIRSSNPTQGTPSIHPSRAGETGSRTVRIFRSGERRQNVSQLGELGSSAVAKMDRRSAQPL